MVLVVLPKSCVHKSTLNLESNRERIRTVNQNGEDSSLSGVQSQNRLNQESENKQGKLSWTVVSLALHIHTQAGGLFVLWNMIRTLTEAFPMKRWMVIGQSDTCGIALDASAYAVAFIAFVECIPRRALLLPV